MPSPTRAHKSKTKIIGMAVSARRSHQIASSRNICRLITREALSLALPTCAIASLVSYSMAFLDASVCSCAALSIVRLYSIAADR